jgi:PilZ domain
MFVVANPKTAFAVFDPEDRCAERVPISIPAALRPSGGPKIHVVVRDISIAGFSCDVVTGMRPGGLCWLTLPGLASQQAEIVWNNGYMAGCAFASLLNQAVLDRIIAMHR